MSRSAILVGVLWLCVFAKLIFYSSFVPLWEGYDEFSHFAFVEHLVKTRTLPDLRNAPTAPEIVESLRAGPVPWTIRNWTGSMTYDDFWSGRRPATTGAPFTNPRLYEAQQPPLAYVLLAIPYAAFRQTSLPTRVWIVRIAGGLIASLAVPFGFLLARCVFDDTGRALGTIAVVSSMPELMMTADHGGNEPFAILLGTLVVYALCLRRAFLTGCLLGLGLLTKAYFLTLIPVAAIVFFRQRRQMLIALATAIAIAGWWYVRAMHVTGNLTGSNTAIAAGQSPVPLWSALVKIQWLQVLDSALISHIWLGGWSFLVLRSWMYRTIELVLLAALAGLIASAVKKRTSFPLAVCLFVQLCFWAGVAWFAVSTWLATGESDVPGYYAYAVVVAEAVCLIAGLSALMPALATRFIAPALVTCLAGTELYSTVFLLMPYYAGITAHTSHGSVPAARFGQIFTGELFRNLAVNKPDFLTPGVMFALFFLFVIAVAGIAAVSLSIAFSERGESGTRATDRLVPLRPR